MEGWILDRDFTTVGIVDAFDSFIWTDRFIGYGDFEIYMPFGYAAGHSFSLENYLALKGSERLMIIEQMETQTNPDQGTKLIITGRSLESMLERRIIWGQRDLVGNFQNGIKDLLDENAINPSIADRKVPGLIFKASTDPYITNLTINTRFIGDNLYDAIFVLCEDRGLGFRILPDTNTGEFVFELYRGSDRSYEQEILPYVTFSPKFENLLSSNFLESQRALKTSALVGGEGEWPDKTTVEVGWGSGLDRREIFIEASGSSRDLPEEEYLDLLAAKGYEELAKTSAVEMFEGEIDATRQFVYGRDFFIGDIVQVVNEYGMEARSRVSELIQTHNVEGESFVPTFTTVQDS